MCTVTGLLPKQVGLGERPSPELECREELQKWWQNIAGDAELTWDVVLSLITLSGPLKSLIVTKSLTVPIFLQATERKGLWFFCGL